VNEAHLRILSSEEWAETLQVEMLPWVVEAGDLGDDVLELGPGPGLTTDLLRQRVRNLTAVEIDPALATALRDRLAGSNVTANAMSPGPVDTPLLHALAPGMKGRTREKGAETVVWLATSPEVAGVSNKLWFDKAERVCKFHNEEQEEKLWKVCEELARKG